MGDLKEQLARAFPQIEHQTAFYAKGSRHPAYNHKSIADTFQQFKEAMLPGPFIDPRGKKISIVKGNFPKLIDLEHQTLSREEIKASEIIQSIEDGTFNEGLYSIEDSSRITTLFWIPELIRDPDAIYRNGHKIIAGDEVYVRVYDKLGSKVKLLFTMDIAKGRKIIRTVPITSFLTDPNMVINFITGQPLYRRK